MATSSSLISGLASGFDWKSMIDSLMAVEHKRVDLITAKKSSTEAKLKEWQSFNTKLLAFKTAAEALSKPASFKLYTSTLTTDSSTVDGEDLLTISAGEEASPGSYSVKITNLAQAQKLSSNPFTSKTSAMGSSYAGEIVINGKTAVIDAEDTLSDVADTINSLNTGSSPSNVTASIVSFGANDYRLILTSGKTGSEGISLLNGSTVNLVQQFGWKDNQTAVIKNEITGGAQGDRFTSSTSAVKSLLGLSTGESGSVTIGDKSVAINLSTMSLTDIKNAINTAAPTGVTASVISQTADDGTAYYRLQIDGTQTFADTKNILNTLGILDHGSGDVSGKISGNAMTSNGSAVTGTALLKNIDGYNTFTAGDHVQLTGRNTANVDIGTIDFTIQSTTTVQDLLDEIETRYGNVLAYVTSDGKIRVDDLSGGEFLVVNLADHIAAPGSALEFTTGDANFGAASDRKREIVDGEDATVEVDGVQITDTDNTVEDIIPGVTLNLIKEDDLTTVNLTVSRDTDALKSKVQDFVTKYNEVRTYINTQFKYNEKTKSTGGVLFGDGTLSSVKTDLVSKLTQTVWGVNSQFSTLGMVGVNMDSSGLLSINDTILSGFLRTNFNDVRSLFVANGVSDSNVLSYSSHTRDTQEGEYAVHIDRAAIRASETGNVDLSAGGAGDTLTITQGSSIASIAISSDMTITDIVNAVNTEFSAEYTQVLAGSQQLKEDDGTTAISSETKWDNISGTSLQDGDVISFSGLSRSGVAVIGSYEIEDASEDQISDFLTAIEAAFSDQVSARIDTTGRIILTDRETGESQLAFAITEPDGRGLDFGTVLTTNTGGEEGRYALSMSASDDGSGQLLIRNNAYGSSGSFTVAQDSTDNQYRQILYSTAANTTVSTNGATHITSATAWEDIYGAQVANGDSITISGKARGGVTDINGTYTITDKATQTVNGLLSAIESAFLAQGTNVDASVRDGKIYVEDLTSGASAIALTVTANNEGGGDLNFGTVDQSTRRDLDLGLINGTYSGLDVAGTIGGEDATGSGQVLTGNSGNANTDGLSLRSTGTTNGTDAGTITFTTGVAELFSRTLFGITDAFEGYVAFKQNSLQDSIDDYQVRIDDMEARLEQKQESLIMQYVRMETILSNLQNQSAWLSSQITAANAAWQ